MVEEVARAIFNVGAVDDVTLPWESVPQGHRDFHLEMARAAIEAMRYPTCEMLRQAEKEWLGPDASWGLMIEVALAEV